MVPNLSMINLVNTFSIAREKNMKKKLNCLIGEYSKLIKMPAFKIPTMAMTANSGNVKLSNLNLGNRLSNSKISNNILNTKVEKNITNTFGN